MRYDVSRSPIPGDADAELIDDFVAASRMVAPHVRAKRLAELTAVDARAALRRCPLPVLSIEGTAAIDRFDGGGH
jgi:hypothetical protein